MTTDFPASTSKAERRDVSVSSAGYTRPSSAAISEARRRYQTACFYGYSTATDWAIKLAALEGQLQTFMARMTSKNDGEYNKKISHERV